MVYKEILNLVPVMQSTALLGENMILLKKKKKKSKDFIETGMTNIFGTAMIKAQADMIGGMD